MQSQPLIFKIFFFTSRKQNPNGKATWQSHPREHNCPFGYARSNPTQPMGTRWRNRSLLRYGHLCPESRIKTVPRLPGASEPRDTHRKPHAECRPHRDAPAPTARRCRTRALPGGCAARRQLGSGYCTLAAPVEPGFRKNGQTQGQKPAFARDLPLVQQGFHP